ncbi:hypothetical protein ABS71_15310 [bacterium SCN 62-11]|nr:hypothetical protein [Candidatus Eremiobacteraeota bacterium]ODT62737.1 MAG: hypothetical protein ABS71_15310 [bacterium SCN 62-11]
MEIKKMGAPTAQAPKTLGAAQPQSDAAPTDQVSVGQSSPQDQAMAVMQQMAQARIELGHELVTKVLGPAPQEFLEVSQATLPHRQEVAHYLASAAEGSETPSEQGVVNSAFYVLATETKTLAQAAVNAENRADYQTKQGGTPDRDALFSQELGYMIEANIYQGQIAPDQLQQILTGPEPEGEKKLSAGAFVEAVRRFVPAEVAEQVTQVAGQNPLILAFADKPDLQKRFTGALHQNFEAANTVNNGCLQYFNVLNAIIQQDLQAQQVLVQAQQQA